MGPTGMLIAVPSRLGVGETFPIKVKLRGAVREVPCANTFCTIKPRMRGPFNLNVERGIQYMDDCLPEWTGRIEVHCDALDGPAAIAFDGQDQGAYDGDKRPIKVAEGFSFSSSGFHFIKLVDPVSGCEAWSNPVHVTDEPPQRRIFWGDPHWQTYFSDGIRCPEELCAFARDEAFLDFGAITDHMEAVTDRQWDYFQAVTNDYNEPGRFATLQGQEWTHHFPETGAPGHRNIYVRGDRAPALRANDPDCNTLDKLWAKLDALDRPGEVLAIPHHAANLVMGVRWELGWNPTYEKAVELYSFWGNSEKSEADGNPRPVRDEVVGRHVVDALKLGYRFGFVGGGDVHDGRPGDAHHRWQKDTPGYSKNRNSEGFTAVLVSELSRESAFDAMATRQTYAASRRGIYLDVTDLGDRLAVEAAAEDGLREAVLVRNGDDFERAATEHDPRIIRTEFTLDDMASAEFAYVRVHTETGEMAWSSPVWGDRQ